MWVLDFAMVLVQLLDSCGYKSVHSVYKYSLSGYIMVLVAVEPRQE